MPWPYFIEIHVFLKAHWPREAALNRLSICFHHSQLDFARYILQLRSVCFYLRIKVNVLHQYHGPKMFIVLALY